MNMVQVTIADNWTLAVNGATLAIAPPETLTVEDEANPGDFYECKIERIARSGGGDVYFDEFAKVYRVTAFYNVKLNL